MKVARIVKTVCLVLIIIRYELTITNIVFASTHGRILSCGHEMCFGMCLSCDIQAQLIGCTDCTLDLRNAPINNTRELCVVLCLI